MRFMRVTARGTGLFVAGFATLALGCVRGEGATTVGATDEALTCEGCPDTAPVETYNEDAPHAFPGTCEEANPEADGAFDEMMDHCRQYCGQSSAQCGATAQLVDVHCVDRDIGHRWEATCVCGAAESNQGYGPGVAGEAPQAPAALPFPAGAMGPDQGSFYPEVPGGVAPGAFSPNPGLWQGAQPGLAQGPWQGPGWQPPSGWWDAPHGFQGVPPGLPQAGMGGFGEMGGVPPMGGMSGMGMSGMGMGGFGGMGMGVPQAGW